MHTQDDDSGYPLGRIADDDTLGAKMVEAWNRGVPTCPYCGLVMSRREAAEQGACNDCAGGAYWPDPVNERHERRDHG